jgi:hypothetical protein
VHARRTVAALAALTTIGLVGSAQAAWGTPGPGDNRQHFRGFLRGKNGRPVQIERLWALLPGTATTGGTDAIWFSAGIGNETHGLVGTFKAAH